MKKRPESEPVSLEEALRRILRAPPPVHSKAIRPPKKKAKKKK
jgi:hypothetical protein